MSRVPWLASTPIRIGNRIRRARAGDWPELPRPSISVGNLAFGGRGKTPTVAALARLATREGLRPAIISRGYGGSVRRTDRPEVVVANPSTEPSWLQEVQRRAGRIGDEPAWLAASCPGVPVAIHPDRRAAAAAALEHAAVDLLLLDDGFQAPVQTSLDLVLLDAELDPPFGPAVQGLREGPAALAHADAVAVVLSPGVPPPALLPSGWHLLRRTPGLLRRLGDGSSVAPEEVLSVRVAAGVGHPKAVAACVRALGICVASSIAVGDHRAPGIRASRSLHQPGPAILVTEKDAVGWAREQLPPESLVLVGGLEGIHTLWETSRTLLATELGPCEKAQASA